MAELRNILWLMMLCCLAVLPIAAASGAERLVTLSPHLAELVVEAGAEKTLIGVSAYTDYPLSLADLPVVSDAFRVDMESILALKPSVVLAWESGTAGHQIANMRQLGIRVEVFEQHRLADIATSIRRIGQLADTRVQAEAAADRFEMELANLQGVNGKVSRVFVQVSQQPLFTLGAGHIVSELVARCGGYNIFNDIPEKAAQVNPESVIRRQPDWILYADTDGTEYWQELKEKGLLEKTRFLAIYPDRLMRATPRMLLSGQRICRSLMGLGHAQ